MNVLIKQARIICSENPYHRKICDLFISDGIIQKIAPRLDLPADQMIEYPDLHVSIGWTDLFADFSDPGFEHRETLETGAAAAAKGGFTDVLVIPNTLPVIDSKTQVEYIKQKSAGLAVNVIPVGAITRKTEGKDLTEMYDMYNSGAIAFSDGIHPLQNPGVMLKALQYVLTKKAPVIQMPVDKSIHPNGLMHEGITSVQIGLPGKPSISEELMISRDIELLRYTGSKLHITGISTRKGIELVSAAKSSGLNISCAVTPYHLHFCDEDLSGYDTQLKVPTFLRTRNDMMALRAALNRGEIDCVDSHHIPLHSDDKNGEFENAKSGMIGLESAFGAVNVFSDSLDDLIQRMTVNPRKIAGLPMPEIKEGSPACLTLFNPDMEYTFDETMISSKSRNSAFKGKTLKGKVMGIINKKQVIIHQP